MTTQPTDRKSKWADVPLEVSVLRGPGGQIFYDDSLSVANSGQALDKLINVAGAKLAIYRLHKVVEAE